MTTRKSKKTKPPAAPEATIDAGDIIKLAERSFADADTNRVGTLEDLAALRTARSHILTRNRDDAAAKGNEAEAKRSTPRSKTWATWSRHTRRKPSSPASRSPCPNPTRRSYAA